ncbi:MAG: type II secretion system F family protein [Anaerolineaceae bacterium]|nr:type II secretion system F family protein [Anaerolineaceae bacterium]
MISAFGGTNQLLIILGVIVAILGFGLAIYGLFIWFKKGNKLSKRLDQFVSNAIEVPIDTKGTKQRQIITREINGSLFSRTIESGFKKLLTFLGRFTPKKLAIELERKLTIAGNPGNLHAGDFYAIRFLVLIAGMIVAFIINRDFNNINMTSVVLGLLVIGICLYLPTGWLNGRVKTTQNEIRRGLPDALDMLSVCASAGLGFDQSLQKISNSWDSELGRKLKRVTQEMEMGSTRAEALKSMSDQLDVDDLTQFITIIIQAEIIGMSYADVLHSQALQMRILRQYRAREIANKLPAKMILPLALMIFPALIAVIVGPAISAILEIF